MACNELQRYTLHGSKDSCMRMLLILLQSAHAVREYLNSASDTLSDKLETSRRPLLR